MDSGVVEVWGLMVCELDSRPISPGSSPGETHGIVSLGETLYSCSVFLHPGL